MKIITKIRQNLANEYNTSINSLEKKHVEPEIFFCTNRNNQRSDILFRLWNEWEMEPSPSLDKNSQKNIEMHNSGNLISQY